MEFNTKNQNIQLVEDVWKKAFVHIQDALNSKIQINTFILPLKPLFMDDSYFVLLAPNEFISSYIPTYKSLLENALEIVTQKKLEIKSIDNISKLDSLLKIIAPSYLPEKENLFQSNDQTNTIKKTTNPIKGELTQDGLLSNYTFDTFIVGSGNQFAHSACLAISNQNCGSMYNPLFLYGGSGLGKTHLMQAVGHSVKEKFPDKKVIYVSCEDFVNEFINTIGRGNFNQFRNKYRNCDLLMIDDIQFIEGKEQMQLEFFYTFNTLYENNKNIIITCDKPPQSLITLEDRLKTRFVSGLMIDIQKPDLETKIAILHQYCTTCNYELPADVLEYIAKTITSNIRELQGACNTVIAKARLINHVDIQLAAESLKNLFQSDKTTQVTPDLIIDIVCNYYNIRKDDIKSKKRTQNISNSRHVAMYIMRSVLDITYEEIAAIFNCHYSSVMHGEDKIKKDKEEKSNIKEDVDYLINRISID